MEIKNIENIAFENSELKYDKQVDALYISFLKKKNTSELKTEALNDDFLIDTNEKNEIIGIEVLNFSEYFNNYFKYSTPQYKEFFVELAKRD